VTRLPRPWVGAIFALALAVRMIHLWQMRGTAYFSVLMGDARGYDQWAQRLAAGDWVGTDVFYQAPLYPYFLGLIYAVAGHDLLAVRLVQAVVGSLSAVLVAVAAARLFSPRAGMVAGTALALYAPAIFFDALIQKSVLDVAFVSAALAAIAIAGCRGSASASPSALSA
jgi:4-amino-4-deoxy-L-arabinose transferase-like glycosyltransferase